MANILFIASYFPAGAATCGSEQRTLAILESLGRIGNVYACVPEKSLEAPVRHGVYANVLRVPGQVPRRAWLRRFANKAAKVLFGWLEPGVRHKTPVFPARLDLDAWFPGVKFDMILVRYFEGLRLFRPWRTGLPVSVDFDDSPVEAFDTGAGAALNPLHRALARRCLAGRVRRYSRRCHAVGLANACAPGGFAGGASPVCLPNRPVMPPAGYRMDVPRAERDSAVFVGTFKYPPNVAAVEWFLDEVWDRWSERLGGLKFRIVGSGLDDVRRAAWARHRNVEVLGFVDDLSAVYSRALAAVVPVRSGSGTSIKTMEALAYGRCCITTRFGARGLDVGGTGGAVRVCDGPDDFGRALLEVAGMSGGELAALGGAAVSALGEMCPSDALDAALRRMLPLHGISIIVPVYNVRPKLLEAALDSVVRQKLDNCEIIVVDDGSTDSDTIGFLEGLGARMPCTRVVRQKENRGQGSARNVGIRLATGEFIGFLDADDWVGEDFYGPLRSRMIADGTDIACGTLCYVKDGQTFVIDAHGDSVVRSRRGNFRLINNGTVTTRLFRRRLFDGVAFPEGYIWEDNPTLLALFLKARSVSWVDGPRYYYRHNETSTCNNPAREHRRVSDSIVVLGLILHMTRGVPWPDRGFVRYRQCIQLIRPEWYARDAVYRSALEAIGLPAKLLRKTASRARLVGTAAGRGEDTDGGTEV